MPDDLTVPAYRARLIEIIAAIDAELPTRSEQDQVVLQAHRDAYDVALQLARRLPPREPDPHGGGIVIPFPQR